MIKVKQVRLALFGLAAAAAIVAPHYLAAACDRNYCPASSFNCPHNCWPTDAWFSVHCYYGTEGECCECFVDFIRCRCDDGGYYIAYNMRQTSYPGYYCRQITLEKSACSPIPPPPDNP